MLIEFNNPRFLTPVLALATLLFGAVCQADMKAFSSDGCSAFPNGSLEDKKAWLRCCVVHDYDYWQGGDYQQRLQADEKLEQCVVEVGEPELAVLMLVGVRVGGTPFLPTTFRWGYGWLQPRFYTPLSEAEQQLVKQQGDAKSLIEAEWQRLSTEEEWYE